jgi:hypothetical protein
MIAVFFGETAHLRFLGAIDTLYQCNTEVAEIDAPDLHAAVRISRTRVVNTFDQCAAFDFDVKPGPLFYVARFNGVRNVIDFLEM